jgi:hypothetical protein
MPLSSPNVFSISPHHQALSQMCVFIFFMIKILMKANKEQFIYAKNLIVFYIIWND